MACFEAPPPGMLDCWFRCSPPPEHSCASLKVTHCIRLDYNCEQIVNPATHIKKYSSRPDTLLGGPKIAGTMPLATRYDASHYPRRVPQSR